MQSRIGFGIESGVKQRRVARDFIPDEIAIHRDALARRREHAQFAPEAQILFRRQPAVGDAFKFGRIQPISGASVAKFDFRRGFPGFFQRGQFGFGNSRRAAAVAAETPLIARALQIMSPR